MEAYIQTIVDGVRAAAKSVPQGYVLVPINPTEEMLAEGCDTLNNEVSWRGKEAESAYPCHLRPVWYAMLAALAAPPQI